jgi:SAM-dependent methyltransferase
MFPASNLFEDPELYEAQYRNLLSDIHFYLELAKRTHGPILELGIGTGRITESLLKLFRPIVGMDLSRKMLNQVKLRFGNNRARPIIAVQGDYRRFNFRCKFGFVFGAFNSLQHIYNQEELNGMLMSARRHLDEKGIFAFDLSHELAQSAAPEQRTPILRETFYDERKASRCEVFQTIVLWEENGVREYLWNYRWASGREETRTLKTRVFPAEVMQTALVRNGFKILQALGSFDGTPLLPNSSKQIYVCGKA